jgi:hypothetical protein
MLQQLLLLHSLAPPYEVLPVVFLRLELHPQLCGLILSQPVHGIKLYSNLLRARQLLSHS